MDFSGLLSNWNKSNFGADDSTIASTTRHPITGLLKLAQYINYNVKTASGIPDEYDNPNPLLAPGPEKQTESAMNLAQLMQLGGSPFAPDSKGGVAGTVTNPFARFYDMVHNLERNQSGTFVPKKTSPYVVNPFEAYDVSLDKENPKGLLVKDMAHSAFAKQHGLEADKLAGVALTLGGNDLNELTLKNLQDNKSLRQMIQGNGVNPVNTEFGKTSFDAMAKIGYLLHDMDIIPNTKTDVQNPGYIADLLRRKAFDPNDQRGLLNYVRGNEPEKLGIWNGSNFYRGIDAKGALSKPEEADMGSSGLLTQWLNDSLSNMRKNLNHST